jgi:hypothetical protein
MQELYTLKFKLLVFGNPSPFERRELDETLFGDIGGGEGREELGIGWDDNRGRQR